MAEGSRRSHETSEMQAEAMIQLLKIENPASIFLTSQ